MDAQKFKRWAPGTKWPCNKTEVLHTTSNMNRSCHNTWYTSNYEMSSFFQRSNVKELEHKALNGKMFSAPFYNSLNMSLFYLRSKSGILSWYPWPGFPPLYILCDRMDFSSARQSKLNCIQDIQSIQNDYVWQLYKPVPPIHARPNFLQNLGCIHSH